MELSTLNVAAVSYLNTIPFIYGLSNYLPLAGILELRLMPPSDCAEAYRKGDTDIALVPVGAMQPGDIENLCCNWCLGAEGPVETVLLISDTPLKEITTIYLDQESSTSVLLVRILARHHWNINPEYLPLERNKTPVLKPGEAALVIGDKTFSLAGIYQYQTDLAEAWQAMTGLPALFACWLTKPGINEKHKQLFDQALSWGIQNIDNAIDELGKGLLTDNKAKRYLTQCISFNLDERKMSALKRFFEYHREL